MVFLFILDKKAINFFTFLFLLILSFVALHLSIAIIDFNCVFSRAEEFMVAKKLTDFVNNFYLYLLIFILAHG